MWWELSAEFQPTLRRCMHRAELCCMGIRTSATTRSRRAAMQNHHTRCEKIYLRTIHQMLYRSDLPSVLFQAHPRLTGCAFDFEIGFPVINQGLAINSYSISHGPLQLSAIWSNCHHSLIYASHHHHNQPLVDVFYISACAWNPTKRTA